MKALWVIFVIALSITQVNAETSIAILDFELNDLTLAPGIPAEIERTASVKPLLEKELNGAGYRIISVPLADQHHAIAALAICLTMTMSLRRLAKVPGRIM